MSRRSHYRIVSAFFQSWRKEHFRIGVARNRGRVQDDAFSRCLLSLIGLGTQGQGGRDRHVEPVMLDFAGLFSHFPRIGGWPPSRPRNEHFGVPIQVLQFQGQWLNLEPEDRSCLGGRGQTGTSNNRLGGNAVLGEEVWDVESRFRIKIGPLQSPARVLPLPSDRVGRRPEDPSATGARHTPAPSLEFDIQLVLPRNCSLEVSLGGAQEHCPLLGWNVWVQTGLFEAENGDAVFSDDVMGGVSN